jgi:hypothetical protein
MNYFKSGSTKSPTAPKKGLIQLNLLVFSLVALVIAFVSYQVGRDISSQLILTNQQSGGIDTGVGVVEITTVTSVPMAPATPTPVQGQLPVVVVPPSNRGNTTQNPAPAVAAPPLPVKPTTTVAAKAPAPKVTAKPVPTTKGS